jgi:large subunit ribosomal protein L9
VTEDAKRQIEREKKLAEVKDMEDQRAAEAVAARIAELDIEIGRRVGDNDALYGSVTSADVAAALKAKGFEIDKRKIVMPEALKALGETTVPIKIHHGVVAQVKVRVVAEKRS